MVSCLAYSSTLTCSSETSDDIQRTTRRYFPEDRTLYNQRCENHRSYSWNMMDLRSLQLWLWRVSSSGKQRRVAQHKFIDISGEHIPSILELKESRKEVASKDRRQASFVLLAACFLLVTCMAYFSTLRMEIERSPETMVKFNRTACRYIPDESSVRKCSLKTQKRRWEHNNQVLWIGGEWRWLKIVSNGSGLWYYGSWIFVLVDDRSWNVNERVSVNDEMERMWKEMFVE
jgi:hypothetical protein